MTTQTEALKLALEAAYLAGFNASGEGYNGEYPFDQVVHTPVENRVWKKDRDNYIKEALAQQSNEQSKCNHTKTITRADINGNQIETTCGECGERVAQQSNEQVEPVAINELMNIKDLEAAACSDDAAYCLIAILERVGPDATVGDAITLIENISAHPPVPYVVEPRTAQPKEPEQTRFRSGSGIKE